MLARRTTTNAFAAIAVLGYGSMIVAGAAAEKSYCAKPWSELTPAQKGILDDITKTVLTQVALPGSPIQSWETRAIPYYVESSTPADLQARIKNVAKAVADRTLVRLVKCDARVIDEPKVRGFIYFGKHSDICKKDPKEPESAACANIGFQPKKPTKVGDKKKDDPLDEAKLSGLGTRIGLKTNNTEGEIMHEIIHALGFRHQHQNPFFSRYGSKGVAGRNCADINNGMWIEYYDPASIMHYPLTTCKVILDCEEGKEEHTWTPLKTCKVDAVIDAGSPCIYGNSKGASCFVRPKKVHKVLPTYDANDFGQHQCMSMLDQALILSRYFPIKKDVWDLKALGDSGVCEKLPELENLAAP